MKNTQAILLLGFFVGLATNLGLIGSQSYLLSQTDAVYTLYGTVISGLFFSTFLRKMSDTRVKFARFSVFCLVFYVSFLVILKLNLVTEPLKAILWYVVAIFGFDLLRWIVSELTLRHLDPARVASYFAYSSAFFEGGTVLVILLLKFGHIVLTPNQTIQIVIVCCGASLALIFFFFLPKQKLEIKFSEKQPTNEMTSIVRLNSLTQFFVLLALTLTVIEIGGEYLVKIMVKDFLQNYDSIKAMTETYMALSCTFIIVLSYTAGRITQDYRVSPLTLLFIEVALIIVMAGLCWILGAFYIFVIFEVLRRTSEYCLYRPAHQMLLSSLTSSVRNRLRSTENFFNYPLETRYDLIKFLLTKYRSNNEAITLAGERLKQSVYDFHKELDYLRLCSTAQLCHKA